MIAVESSLVYSHILVYRSVMNLLYKGGYRARFEPITRLIGRDVHSVCDLCFGDTVIAEWCRARGIEWTGIDLNPYFCSRARRMGFGVLEGDLLALDLPYADVFVMAGSLYHFHDWLSDVFEAVLQRTGRFIVSEPVHNLSSQPGLLGWWARRSANPGNGPASFRYDETSLVDAIRGEQQRHGFTFNTISTARDMLLEIERRPAKARLNVC
jgi:SAM-dependent methyltransferase